MVEVFCCFVCDIYNADVSSILFDDFGFCEGGVSLSIVGDSDMLSGCGWSFSDFVSFCLSCNFICQIFYCFVLSDGCRCRSGCPLFITLTHLSKMWTALGKCIIGAALHSCTSVVLHIACFLIWIVYSAYITILFNSFSHFLFLCFQRDVEKGYKGVCFCIFWFLVWFEEDIAVFWNG